MEKLALIGSLFALALAAGLMLTHVKSRTVRSAEWGLVGFAGVAMVILLALAIPSGGFDLSMEKVSKAVVVVALGALLVLALIAVASDANARGRRGGLWAVLVFLTWPLGLALWALVAFEDRRKGRRGIRFLQGTSTEYRLGAFALAGIVGSWLALSLLPIQATYQAAVVFTRGSTTYQIGDTVPEECGSAINVIAGINQSTPSMNGIDVSNDWARSDALNHLWPGTPAGNRPSHA